MLGSVTINHKPIQLYVLFSDSMIMASRIKRWTETILEEVCLHEGSLKEKHDSNLLKNLVQFNAILTLTMIMK
jgi:hypothetical protein